MNKANKITLKSRNLSGLAKPKPRNGFVGAKHVVLSEMIYSSQVEWNVGDESGL